MDQQFVQFDKTEQNTFNAFSDRHKTTHCIVAVKIYYLHLLYIIFIILMGFFFLNYNNMHRFENSESTIKTIEKLIYSIITLNYLLTLQGSLSNKLSLLLRNTWLCFVLFYEKYKLRKHIKVPTQSYSYFQIKNFAFIFIYFNKYILLNEKYFFRIYNSTKYITSQQMSYCV